MKPSWSRLLRWCMSGTYGPDIGLASLELPPACCTNNFPALCSMSTRHAYMLPFQTLPLYFYRFTFKMEPLTLTLCIGRELELRSIELQMGHTAYILHPTCPSLCFLTHNSKHLSLSPTLMSPISVLSQSCVCLCHVFHAKTTI